MVQLGQLIDRFATKWSAVPNFEQRLYGFHDPEAPQPEGQYPGVTGASDTIFMSTHSGSHMDSLSHVAVDGVLFDGTRVTEPGVQDERTGVRLRTRENLAPIVSRGVLLDIAAFLGVDLVPRDYVLGREEFDACCRERGVEVRAGDTVLFRTGYDTLAHDNDEYVRLPLPGPDGEVCRLLVERGVVSTGSDTMPFEAAPGPLNMAGHVELLVRGGVFIYEMLDLRELAQQDAREFVFVAAPLRLRGGTGSPVNPLAVLL
ncbi:cyclase family protein [Microbacterium sp.]|uniref:cyclase family protein n=1 Tax=Microbacterium sp. TaxID=51671 RepID=UPI003A87EBC7